MTMQSCGGPVGHVAQTPVHNNGRALELCNRPVTRKITLAATKLQQGTGVTKALLFMTNMK